VVGAKGFCPQSSRPLYLPLSRLPGRSGWCLRGYIGSRGTLWLWLWLRLWRRWCRLGLGEWYGVRMCRVRLSSASYHPQFLRVSMWRNLLLLRLNFLHGRGLGAAYPRRDTEYCDDAQQLAKRERSLHAGVLMNLEWPNYRRYRSFRQANSYTSHLIGLLLLGLLGVARHRWGLLGEGLCLFY